jgi:exopolyphosphatase/guanosine-5'-triphosphate,3'-diphosphate pyrophosphatase
MTLLDRVQTRSLAVSFSTKLDQHFARIAIIDIGSNSVRLVVFDGPSRVPFVLFNEKVMAGLGNQLSTTGRISEDAMARGLAALARFRQLCTDMEVDDIRGVATAAVRDASNGRDFIAKVEQIGLPIRLLSGDEESRASACGLISGMPDADGIMGDLGGGSLELVRVRKGEILASLSAPLGVLRIKDIRAKGKGALAKAVRKTLEVAGWPLNYRGLPFYMVGGSWRALARVDMHALDYPLPIFQGYEMGPERIDALETMLSRIDKMQLKGLSSLSGGRIPTLPDAAALMRELCRSLIPSHLVVSAFGLREGLLYQDLPADIAAQDPLLVAARAEGDAQGRFVGHGDLIDEWIAPLFGDDSLAMRRIRHAACLLADVGWRANPDFRAERGLETGLHGNWAGITAAERAMLGQSLYTSFGGAGLAAPSLRRLTSSESLDRAMQWGLAIRFAQRLSGGVAPTLERISIARQGKYVTLNLSGGAAQLIGEAAERRLKQLATAMGCDCHIAI